MDAALRELLTTGVAHQARLASDIHDKGIYGDPRPLMARVVEKAEELRTRDSRVVVTRGYMILGAEAGDVVERDRFALAGLGGDFVDVLAVSKPRDIDQSIHHVRVDFV